MTFLKRTPFMLMCLGFVAVLMLGTLIQPPHIRAAGCAEGADPDHDNICGGDDACPDIYGDVSQGGCALPNDPSENTGQTSGGSGDSGDDSGIVDQQPQPPVTETPAEPIATFTPFPTPTLKPTAAPISDNDFNALPYCAISYTGSTNQAAHIYADSNRDSIQSGYLSSARVGKPIGEVPGDDGQPWLHVQINISEPFSLNQEGLTTDGYIPMSELEDSRRNPACETGSTLTPSATFLPTLDAAAFLSDCPGYTTAIPAIEQASMANSQTPCADVAAYNQRGMRMEKRVANNRELSQGFAIAGLTGDAPRNCEVSVPDIIVVANQLPEKLRESYSQPETITRLCDGTMPLMPTINGSDIPDAEVAECLSTNGYLATPELVNQVMTILNNGSMSVTALTSKTCDTLRMIAWLRSYFPAPEYTSDVFFSLQTCPINANQSISTEQAMSIMISLIQNGAQVGQWNGDVTVLCGVAQSILSGEVVSADEFQLPFFETGSLSERLISVIATPILVEGSDSEFIPECSQLTVFMVEAFLNYDPATRPTLSLDPQIACQQMYNFMLYGNINPGRNTTGRQPQPVPTAEPRKENETLPIQETIETVTVTIDISPVESEGLPLILTMCEFLHHHNVEIESCGSSDPLGLMSVSTDQRTELLNIGGSGEIIDMLNLTTSNKCLPYLAKEEGKMQSVYVFVETVEGCEAERWGDWNAINTNKPALQILITSSNLSQDQISVTFDETNIANPSNIAPYPEVAQWYVGSLPNQEEQDQYLLFTMMRGGYRDIYYLSYGELVESESALSLTSLGLSYAHSPAVDRQQNMLYYVSEERGESFIMRLSLPEWFKCLKNSFDNPEACLAVAQSENLSQQYDVLKDKRCAQVIASPDSMQPDGATQVFMLCYSQEGTHVYRFASEINNGIPSESVVEVMFPSGTAAIKAIYPGPSGTWIAYSTEDSDTIHMVEVDLEGQPGEAIPLPSDRGLVESLSWRNNSH